MFSEPTMDFGIHSTASWWRKRLVQNEDLAARHSGVTHWNSCTWPPDYVTSTTIWLEMYALYAHTSRSMCKN